MRGFLERVAAIRDEQQMESFDWRRETLCAVNMGFRSRGQQRTSDKICPACGEPFYSPKNQGTQVYCSRECYKARKVKGQLALVFVQETVAVGLKTANKMREHG